MRVVVAARGALGVGAALDLEGRAPALAGGAKALQHGLDEFRAFLHVEIDVDAHPFQRALDDLADRDGRLTAGIDDVLVAGLQRAFALADARPDLLRGEPSGPAA